MKVHWIEGRTERVHGTVSGNQIRHAAHKTRPRQGTGRGTRRAQSISNPATRRPSTNDPGHTWDGARARKARGIWPRRRTPLLRADRIRKQPCRYVTVVLGTDNTPTPAWTHTQSLDSIRGAVPQQAPAAILEQVEHLFEHLALSRSPASAAVVGVRDIRGHGA